MALLLSHDRVRVDRPLRLVGGKHTIFGAAPERAKRVDYRTPLKRACSVGQDRCDSCQGPIRAGLRWSTKNDIGVNWALIDTMSVWTAGRNIRPVGARRSTRGGRAHWVSRPWS